MNVFKGYFILKWGYGTLTKFEPSPQKKKFTFRNNNKTHFIWKDIKEFFKTLNFGQKSVGFWIFGLETPQSVLPQSTNHYQKHSHFRSTVYILFPKSVHLKSCVSIDEIFFHFEIIENISKWRKKAQPNNMENFMAVKEPKKSLDTWICFKH